MVDARRIVEAAWRGDGPGARLLQAALAPLSWSFGAAVRARNALYDRGVLAQHRGPIPALSVGNLSVGGTGKTPVAAWLAARALALGAKPAIVLRGYGDDEPLVHAAINPAVPVIIAADRVEGVARASAAGADVAILDDAFQHRRAARDLDIVLLSADGWRAPARLLPAGPWREPLASLSRASTVVITRKAASIEQAAELARCVRDVVPRTPVAVLHLAPDQLRRAVSPGGAEGVAEPIDALRGQRVLAIAAIGDPDSFSAQLAAAGARVTLRGFADHHAYDSTDVAQLVAAAEQADRVVCTLKDAVKLGPRWPADRVPLWYVSQRVVPEAGEAELQRLLDALLSPDARRARTVGSGRPQSPTHGY